MPTYVYKALTKKGEIVKNRVESTNKQTLIKKLKNTELLPIAIQQVAYGSKTKKQKKNVTDIKDVMKNINTTHVNREEKREFTVMEKLNIYLGATEKVTQRDLVVFTQNFYLLKKAEFNNIHALKTIIEGTDNLSLKGILEDILAGVEGGDYMHTTMEYYSEIFPYIYINMIKVGELSGSLTKSLEQAVKYLDESEALTKKVKAILVPNLIQFILLLVMLVVGTLYAIPAIQSVLDSVGSTDQLPAVTLWFADVVDVMMLYWYLPVVVILGIATAIFLYIRTPKGKYNYDLFKYKMPVFGELIFAIDFSRLTKAMLLNLQNGMRIQESIEVSRNVTENYVMMSITETSINNLLVGASWIEPFEQSGLTKPMMTEMLNIGMQTDLVQMMEKLVEYMDIDINVILNRIMKVLPQIVYAIVGVVLIFFVIVVLVPIIQIYMGNFLFSAYGV